MRIAIVAEVFLPKIDGVVNRTLKLIHHLLRAGDDVMIICPRADGCTDCPVSVVDVPSFSFPLYPEYRIGLPDRRVTARLKAFRADVVHFINPFAFGFRCHDIFRKAGLRVPTVFSFHTLYGEFVKRYRGLQPLSKLLWWLMRQYHNRADVNLTVSSIMREELVRRGFRHVELWPPAVDSELFHPGRRSAAMRGRLTGGNPERPLLLTVSRLAPEKNVGFLAGVIKEFPDACLAVVGDGPQRAELERRFEGTNTRFFGYLRGEELAAAYASADAFVYASEMETMGNVVLEAMSCGCAVVAPNAGGIPNLLRHGTSGLLFPPGDRAAAVAHTRVLLADAGIRRRLGEAARLEIEEKGWERSIAHVRAIYTAAMDDRAGRLSKWTWQQRLAQATTLALVSTFRSLGPGRLRRMITSTICFFLDKSFARSTSNSEPAKKSVTNGLNLVPGPVRRSSCSSVDRRSPECCLPWLCCLLRQALGAGLCLAPGATLHRPRRAGRRRPHGAVPQSRCGQGALPDADD